MKKTEKAAIARIITDLIKADGIIDLREMNTLDDLQNKYDITDNDWKSGGSIHLAESLDVLKELDAETRQELLNDFCHVAMSDDFCAKEEALLLLCLQLILKPHNDFKAQILSVNSTELNFDNSQMLYVEGEYDESINTQMRQNYREICNEVRLSGFELVYLPKVSEHYQSIPQHTLLRIASLLYPQVGNKRLDYVVQQMLTLNTATFCNEHLAGKLQMKKLQGHWIIEMSEMMATANAKSIEEIKSFLSRQKEVYKIPYETHPADRPRQCVFGGTSNALDFLPLDRSGNRRFIPVMVYPEQAEVHILEDEAASRAYIEQMWAEAMEIYRSGRFKLAFSPDMQRYLKEHQRDFMPEDTKAGMIQAYLDRYTGSMVCSKQLYKEALNHAFDEPKQWEIREINEIMNQCIDRWRYFPNPRMFSEYGRQKGWERENPATDLCNPSEKAMDGFVEVTEQMELPF